MRNILYKNTIVDACSELVPSIHIAPLDLSQLTESVQEAEQCALFRTNMHVSLHKKARYAITAALEDLQLRKDDVVTILTTSGNYYVSGCVTRAIEQVCQWNREICDKTRTILVIHEFGYPYKGLSELKKYGLPIIEDCAYAYFTMDPEMGGVGDYVIYSLTKAFNMQIGGVMFSRSVVEDGVSQLEKEYISAHLSHGLKMRASIIEKRKRNYAYLCNTLAPIGIKPFFAMEEGVVPGAFLFRWKEDIDYPKLKEFMQRNGVESSVFYTEKAFYIPLHQNLTKNELDYMINLLDYYNETK